MRSVVSVQSMIKTFDDGSTVAVDDLSFEATEGKIISLLGPSGCGKTTTLRAIAGVEHIDQGEIQIADNVVSSESTYVPPEDRGIGMVFQNYAIWPDKTVYGNVVFPLKFMTDMDKSEYEDRVMEVLELVQIPHLRDKAATDLSGGQQQRTALARAIVHDPEVLLLDEPLSNLDAKLRTEMRNEIQRIQYEVDTTMIYVTHDQEEAFYLSDEVIVMRDGKIIERGEPDQLYNRPQSSFTRKFVGRWNDFNGKINDRTLEVSELFDGNISFDEFDLEHVPESGNVDVYLRPTDIPILENDDKLRADGNDSQLRAAGDILQITGTIIAEGVLGELYEMTVDLGESEITIQMPEYPDCKRGDKVTLGIDPADLQVYSQGDS